MHNQNTCIMTNIHGHINNRVPVILFITVFLCVMPMRIMASDPDYIYILKPVYSVVDKEVYGLIDRLIEIDKDKEYYFEGSKIIIWVRKMQETGTLSLSLWFQGFDPIAAFAGNYDGCFPYRGHECLLVIDDDCDCRDRFVRTDAYYRVGFADSDLWGNAEWMTEMGYLYKAGKFKLVYYYEPTAE